MSAAVAQREEDHAQWFLTYLHFAGDLRRVQMALQIPMERLAEVSTANDWPGKLRNEVGDSPETIGPDLQRSLNRATNFVQANQLRKLCDRILTHFSRDDERMAELITVCTPKGSYIDTSPLKNLAASIELAQKLSCAALGDNTERTLEESSGNQNPVKVAKAMQKALAAADADPTLGSIRAVQEAVGAEGKHSMRRIVGPARDA